MLCKRAMALALSTGLIALSPTPIRAVSSAGAPYRVDDLLALEDIGQVEFTKNGALVLIERLRRYDSALSYAEGPWGQRSLGTILAAPADGSRPLQPLFEQESEAGYWMGGFSPSGTKLSVFRLRQHTLDLGVVDILARTVRWLPVVPDMPLLYQRPQWIDDDHLAIVTMTHQRLPAGLALGAATDDSVELWAAQATGIRPSSITVMANHPVPRHSNDREVQIVDVRDGRSRRIYQGPVVDLSVGSKRLALVSLAGASLIDPREPVTAFTNANRYALDVLSLDAGGQPKHIADDIMPGLLTWNPNGTRLLFATRDNGSSWRKPRLRFASFSTLGFAITPGPIEPQVTSGWTLADIKARWSGERLLAEGVGAGKTARWRAARVHGGGLAIEDLPSGQLVASDSRAVTLKIGSSLWRTPLNGRRPRRVARDVMAVGGLPWGGGYLGIRAIMNPPDRDIPLLMQNGETARVAVLQRNGGLSPAMPSPLGADLLAAHVDHAVLRTRDERGAATLWLLRPRHTPLKLATLNEHLAARQMPRVVQVEAVMSDGKKHRHWLLLPNRPAGTSPPPLVVTIYPGQLRDDRPSIGLMRSSFQANQNASILVGHGYAVLLPSLPFSRKQKDPFGALTVDLAHVVEAAEITGAVDANRVAIIGHSFGGYGALAIATRTSRYRAFVAENAPADMGAAYGSLAGHDRTRLESGLPLAMGIGWPEAGQGEMGVAPWQDPRGYTNASPFYALDRIRSPLLLVGGDQDFVSVESAERSFLALTRLARDVTLVRYWGEGHDLLSPANIRDYYEKLFSFLDKRLSSPPDAHDRGGSKDAYGNESPADVQ